MNIMSGTDLDIVYLYLYLPCSLIHLPELHPGWKLLIVLQYLQGKHFLNQVTCGTSND